MSLALLGPSIALSLSMIGSAVGCGWASQAACSAMSQTEEDHVKFLGFSAMPASQAIYGIVLANQLFTSISRGMDPIQGLSVGLFVGLAIMLSAFFQGRVAAAGIQAALRSPEVFFKAGILLGIVETFAIFPLVFGLSWLS